MKNALLVALLLVVALGVGYLIGSGRTATTTTTSTRTVEAQGPTSEVEGFEEEFGIEDPCEEFEIPASVCHK
jgi:hypothetical protein